MGTVLRSHLSISKPQNCHLTSTEPTWRGAGVGNEDQHSTGTQSICLHPGKVSYQGQWKSSSLDETSLVGSQPGRGGTWAPSTLLTSAPHGGALRGGGAAAPLPPISASHRKRPRFPSGAQRWWDRGAAAFRRLLWAVPAAGLGMAGAG